MPPSLLRPWTKVNGSMEFTANHAIDDSGQILSKTILRGHNRYYVAGVTVDNVVFYITNVDDYKEIEILAQAPRLLLMKDSLQKNLKCP